MPDDIDNSRLNDAEATDRSEKQLHDDVRYDETEVSITGLTLILLAIAGSFAFIGLVAWWFLGAQEPPNEPLRDASSYARPSAPLPRPPRLEPLESNAGRLSSNVFERQLLMERILHAYGKTEDAQFVRVPIEQAIRVMVGQVASSGHDMEQLHKSFGLVDGGESNSGRIYQEAPSWLVSKH